MRTLELFSRALIDHKVLFPLVMFSFYVVPYLVDILRIPYSKFTYPDVWLWGLLFFSMVSYLTGSIFFSRVTIISRVFKYREKLRVSSLCLLFFLAWLYLNLLGLPPIQSAAGSILYVVFWALLLRKGFGERVSVLLIIGSLAAMMLTFIVMGGLPLFNHAILKHAKLSPARELALPMFILGAVSFSLDRMRKPRVVSYMLSIMVFAIGALVFAINGDMHDLLAISLGFLLAVLYRCSNTGRMLIIGFLVFMGLLASYLAPRLLSLFRQSFNLQVLRHILLYVNDPILGSAKGAISLGLKRDFLGTKMIYGEGENWTLTSTWLGPAYLDLGLIGVFLTMFTLGATLELMLQVLKMSEDNIPPATLYLTTLSIVMSLLEDGASLPVVMFIVLMVYATFSRPPKVKPSQSGFKASSLKFFLIVLTMSLIDLVLLAYAYCSEFGGLKTVVHTQKITQESTRVDTVLEPSRFYHVKLIGPGTVCLEGEMTVLSDTGVTTNVLRQVSFKGCFWVAKVDQIDLGWFSMGGQGSRCVILLELANCMEEPSEVYLRVETPSLTPWVSNDALIQIAICISFLMMVLLTIDNVKLTYAPIHASP
ncbi:MAG: hypothetical protein QXF52_00595 [Thermoproteota archaeon]